ncbi:uncharacterized protein LOC144432841 [Glandiceps talaboti]
MSSRSEYGIIFLIITTLVVTASTDIGDPMADNATCVFHNTVNTTLPEDVHLGFSVTCFSVEWGVRIMSGNKHGRFKESVENGSSCIEVAAYLDYGLQHTYTLHIVEKIKSGNCSNVYLLRISLEDMPKWPPYFNDSCVMPNSRAPSETWPFPITLYESTLRYDLRDRESYEEGINAMKMDNDKCALTVYRSQYMEHPKPEDEVNQASFYCKDTVTEELFPITSHFYDLKTNAEFPEDAIALLDIDKMRDNYEYLHILSFNNDIIGAANPLDCYVYDNFRHRTVSSIHGITAELLGCPPGKYGGLCQFNCICQNGATCHTYNGACKCAAGYKGVACDIAEPIVTISPESGSVLYGQYVQLQCYANGMNGYTNFIGLLNGNQVQLVTQFEANRNATGNTGEIEIDQASETNTGRFECRYIDAQNNVFSAFAYINISGCPEHYWGRYCSKTCNCKNGGLCDRYNGCLCSDGWTGDTCTEICSAGWYGPNCKTACQCEHGAECDVKDGTCSCPEGSCGIHCQEICSCEDSFKIPMCNASNECICLEGVSNHKTSTPVWIPIVIVIALIVFSVIIVVCISLLRKRKPPTLTSHQRLDNIDIEAERMIKTLSQNIQVIQHEVPRSHLKLGSGIILGQGEYGHVERAEIVNSEGAKTVAVKTFSEEKAHLYNYRDFCHEVETLILLKGHENIIEFIGVTLGEGPKYIIVEYAALGDLLDYLTSLRRWHVIPQVDESRLIQYSKDVAKALQFLREKKIVHRDVAARNILLTDGYVAKIGDFGLSRNVCLTKGGYEKVPWAADQGPLPLKWMPVEFLSKGIFKPEGDIWSFGVLMWEIATLGETPFFNVDALEFYRRLCRGERLERTRRCTKAGYHVMRQCWQSPPQLRPTPAKIIKLLDGLLQDDEGLFIRHEERRHCTSII